MLEKFPPGVKTHFPDWGESLCSRSAASDSSGASCLVPMAGRPGRARHGVQGEGREGWHDGLGDNARWQCRVHAHLRLQRHVGAIREVGSQLRGQLLRHFLGEDRALAPWQGKNGGLVGTGPQSVERLDHNNRVAHVHVLCHARMPAHLVAQGQALLLS